MRAEGHSGTSAKSTTQTRESFLTTFCLFVSDYERNTQWRRSLWKMEKWYPGWLKYTVYEVNDVQYCQTRSPETERGLGGARMKSLLIR